MSTLLRSLRLAGALAVLGLGTGSAHAQAPVASYPGYYYSAGGYNGGYYYRPGYYPIARPPVAVPAPVVIPHAVTHVAPRPKYIEDWSTGRTNYPLPLTKPWMRPLQ